MHGDPVMYFVSTNSEKPGQLILNWSHMSIAAESSSFERTCTAHPRGSLSLQYSCVVLSGHAWRCLQSTTATYCTSVQARSVHGQEVE